MKETCNSCGRESEEVCQDGYCRACHKSLTFEDCCSGEWARRFRLSMGVDDARDGER
jgi:hypothetical protein